ncbi:hypothetical protein HAX54_042782 [Datura stramonium]|uniref:Uncharacterized protein n=1 Tax=Datura stramonium TaxID=4076 RepID=A0ABS8W0C9_DATST|nr:hypothetical protein [Datura stramonium]
MTHNSLTDCNVDLGIQVQQHLSHDAYSTIAANGIQKETVQQHSEHRLNPAVSQRLGSEQVQLLRSNQVLNVGSNGVVDNLVLNEIMVQDLDQRSRADFFQGQAAGLVQHLGIAQQVQNLGLKQRSMAEFIDSNVDSSQGLAAGLVQQLDTVQQVLNFGLKHAVFKGTTQGHALSTDQIQDLNSSQEQLQKLEQMYLQKSLTREGTLVDGSAQDQSSKSKSKNKLSKKRRNAIKRKMEDQKGISKGSSSLIFDENKDASISPSQDNQNNSTESQKSKIPSQQSKCSQQSKYDIQANLQNQNIPITEQSSPLRRPLFVDIQERTNITPIQTAQGDTNKRKGDVLKRRHQQEGRNKEGVGTNFILVIEQAGLSVSPLQVPESPPRECTLNSIPVMPDDSNDEYRVILSRPALGGMTGTWCPSRT